MKRRSKILLGTLGLLGVTAGIWFGSGAYQARRFDRRLATLRAEAKLQMFADLRFPPIPEGANGWGLLKNASQRCRDLERRVYDALIEKGREELLPEYGAPNEWTPAQRAQEVDLIRQLAPVFEQLEEALARPQITATGTPPLDSVSFVDVALASDLWGRRARLDAEGSTLHVDRLLRLYQRWTIRDGADAGMRAAHWGAVVLPALREGIEAGSIDASRLEAWGEILAAEERRLLDHVLLAERWERATALWLVQAWRRGEDPLASLRASLDEIEARLPGALGALAGSRGLFTSEVDRLNQPSLAPLYSAWCERPLLHRYANDVLDELAGYDVRPWDLERLRSVALVDAAPPSRQVRRARTVLRVCACLRLARVALAARRAVEHGGGSAFDLRVGVAARLGGSHLRDALGGELFVMAQRGGAIVIHPRPSAALEGMVPAGATSDVASREDLLHEALLLWRVPLPP